MSTLTSVRFRCDEREVTVRYCGRRTWTLSGSERWSGGQDEVATAIRTALHLAGDIPYDTKTIEVVADGTDGTIKNNTFPTDRWIYDLNGERSCMGVGRGLDATIMATLAALRLAAVEQPPQTVVLDEASFGRASLETSNDPDAWAEALGRALTSRLESAADPAAEVSVVVADLAVLGHVLWRFVDDDDFAVWEEDDRATERGRRLRIDFSFPPYEEPSVRVTIDGPRSV